MLIQVFQGAAENVKKAADEAKESAPSISAPSVSLPKFNVPNLAPKIFSDGGDIDPRAVALPGQINDCCNIENLDRWAPALDITLPNSWCDLTMIGGQSC